MKRITFLMLFTLVVCRCLCQTTDSIQVDTVRWDVRDTAYYYWGSEWYDSAYWNSTADSVRIEVSANGPLSPDATYKLVLSRPCYTEGRLHIVGIAAPIISPGQYRTRFTTRGEEFFRLYQNTDTGMTLMKTVRWDTLTPNKVWTFYADVASRDIRVEYDDKGDEICEHIVPYTYSAPIYEAFFESPIEVHDTFYVAGTALHNYEQAGSINNDGIVYWKKRTAYLWIGLHDMSVSMNYYNPDDNYYIHSGFDYHLRKVHWPEMSTNDTTIWDTVVSHGWLAIFPILSYPPGWGEEHPEDTLECTVPLGLRVLDVAHDTVSLTWLTNSAANRWELWLRRDSAEADSGLWVQTTSPVCQFEGLDTAQWYEVQVRALCDSTHTSDWSDSIRFYLPGWEPDDPGNPDDSVAVHSPVEQFTYVAPNPAAGMVTVASSFRLERVELYSLKGTLVTAADAEGELALTLDVSRIPAGVYMLRVHTPAGTAIKRLVVK